MDTVMFLCCVPPIIASVFCHQSIPFMSHISSERVVEISDCGSDNEHVLPRREIYILVKLVLYAMLL